MIEFMSKIIRRIHNKGLVDTLSLILHIGGG